MLKVCISGGPGGGKSECQEKLIKMLRNKGYKTLVCPETATELIANGIAPGENISMDEFQELVLDKQIAKEDLYDRAAEHFDKDKLVILYDRGICDQFAYMNREMFTELLYQRGLYFSDAMNRYDAVLVLESAAVGAEKDYLWNDPTKEDCGNNAARSESPELARDRDEATKNAWIGHPHMRFFSCTNDFKEKVNKVISEVFSLLGEPMPKEIERKFLIKMPTEKEMEALGCVSSENIVQTYLISDKEGVERRIRQRGSKENGYSFFYTEKEKINGLSRYEDETNITAEQYTNLLVEADPQLMPIHKTRHCFCYKNQYFEMDIYPDFIMGEYAILELELGNESDPYELPPLNVVKEVTNDSRFKNHSIANRMLCI